MYINNTSIFLVLKEVVTTKYYLIKLQNYFVGLIRENYFTFPQADIACIENLAAVISIDINSIEQRSKK